MMNNKIDLLICPLCKGKIRITSTNKIICKRCKKNIGKKIGKIYSFIDTLEDDQKLSSTKWDEFYKQQFKHNKYNKEFQYYENTYLKDVLKVFPFSLDKQKNNTFLEIGCGNMFLGQILSNKFKIIVGVDFSLSALMIAEKMLEKKKIKNYLLIQGNILHLPINNNSVDVVYGGGVIEHFKDTQGSITDIYRVLKNKGCVINTVPFLNIASLTYRQLWGNIPNAPILRELAEIIHIKILKSRHMIFGYEMSFLKSTLIRIHKNVGFKRITISRFEIALQFSFLPKFIRPIFIWLAENSSLFWPMVKVIAYK